MEIGILEPEGRENKIDWIPEYSHTVSTHKWLD